ncbi:DNA replication and repair protein RecN [Stanieria cyanosphaera PCC 7437]|uniref:DNA repair protein RecN n=1 Tax=Stanieria cyanosphaera (strain ATCC 29371 / PCC 7437) TaxID=111780 RepID=K9XUW1_STAC7|nr:DNA repair protein RecN [Stanieria cyanosphaera]AFZ35849.1 DNA replication and repair protein RecN [Stanieria cyanosphaera PCC 7437]
MLLGLRISNFALIDRLELDFNRGLNVLTGETGAGKSIILDAIDVALGGKVNHRMIRAGCQRAIIEATFQVDSHLIEWLQLKELEPLDEDSVVCSREISNNNGNLRSRCRVNGVVANRQVISELRDRLVEITAQGQTVNLLIPEMQRELLDLYGGKSLLQQREQVTASYAICLQTKQALEKRRQSEQERLQRQDILSYQIKELQEAQLSEEDELEQLEQERDRLSHVVDLQQLSYRTYQILYQNDTEEPAAADLLAQAESTLLEMVDYDRDLDAILEMVRSGINQIVEAGQQINSYGEGLEADPERLTEVEERIRVLKRICRKYGPNLADAIAYYQQLQQELAELTDSGQSIEVLEAEYQTAQANYNQLATQLTQLRKTAAKKLEKQLVKELKPLAMAKVVFECRLIPIPATAKGIDKVVFYFSPNPGEEVQPLSIIASGGEMSRFLLALKACFSDAENHSSTLIFDEIDAGVSGKVAQAIAEKLHQLSQQHQVLCVTHQPLIAAMADVHFKVEKQIIEESLASYSLQNGDSSLPDLRTVIRIQTLENHLMRREELAQLTGGHSADEAVSFADSLLNKAANYRQQQTQTS